MRVRTIVVGAVVVATTSSISPMRASAADPTVPIASVVRSDALLALKRGEQRVLVQMAGEVSTPRFHEIAARFGVGSIGRRYRNVPAFSARLNLAQARQLASSTLVRSIELDATVKLDPPAPSQRVFGGPSPVPIRAADPGIGAAATAFGLTGDAGHDGAKTYSPGDEVIAVIDTGIDATHPDLDGGKVLTFQNFVSAPDASCPPMPAAPARFDDNGHGTHVASIAAGEGDVDAAHAGVAPAAALVVVKAFDCTGSASTSDIAAALDWMITNRATFGIDVANMSFGSVNTDGTDVLSVLANRATAMGVIAVAAAGNSGPSFSSVGAPGTARFVVTAGAARVGPAGRAEAAFSSRGPTIDGRVKPDVLAPGVEIDAAWANHPSKRYRFLSGSSMASPVVAGLAALALQAKPSLRPSGTLCSCPDGVDPMSMSTPFTTLLHARARDWNRPGPDNDSGSGLAEAYPLLAAAAGGSTGGPAYPAHAARTGSLAAGQSAVWPLRVTSTSQPVAIELSLPSVNGFFGPFWTANVVDERGNSLVMSDDCTYTEYDGVWAFQCYKFAQWRSTNSRFTPLSVGNYFLVLTANIGASDYVLDLDGFAAVGASGVPIQLTSLTPAVEGGASGGVAVALGQAPSPATSVSVYGDGELSAPTASLTFDSSNWSVLRTVTIPAINDTAVEGPHSGRVFAVTASSTPFARVAASVPSAMPIIDNDGPRDAPHVERVSLKPGGYESLGAVRDGFGMRSSVTPDGAVVAWESEAPDFAPREDDGPAGDVFVRGRRAGSTERVSLGPNGEASSPATLEGLSDDGTLVLFSTYPALTPDDTNGDFDLYVRDRIAQTTTRVDLRWDGTEMPQRPCRTNGKGCLAIPAGLSGDGRSIAFITDAPMTPEDTNGATDVFKRDLVTGAVTRVSVSSSGSQGNGGSSALSDQVHISRDGTRVLFTSSLDGLVAGDQPGAVDLFVHDLATGATRLANSDASGARIGITQWAPAVMSPNGAYAMYAANDSGPRIRLVVKDLATGAIRLANQLADGTIARYFVVAQGISDDGANALFYTEAPELGAPPGGGVVLRNLATGAVQLMAQSQSGGQVGGSSQFSLSATARFGAFATADETVVSGDTNGTADMFLRTLAGNTPIAVVTSPRVFDQWAAGSPQTIRWRAIAPPSATATIDLVTPSGVVPIASGILASQESFAWTAPSTLVATPSSWVRVTINGYTASSTQFTIIPAVLPKIAVGSAAVVEGASGSRALRFTVSLSTPSAVAVSADYVTVAGTATAGADFVAKSGVVTIPAGVRSVAVTVSVPGDTIIEPTETFTVRLSGLVGVVMGRSAGTGSILNDDVTAGQRVAVGNASVVEGNSGSRSVWFTVSLATPATVPVSVDYMTVAGTATAGTDYSTRSGTLTIPVGSTSATIAITVKADTSLEANETFTVRLATPVGAVIGRTNGTGTILNDD